MTVLKRIDSYVDRFLGTICVFFLLVLFALLTLNVFFRFVPIYSMGWFDEIVELSFTCLTFFGAAFLWRRRDHSRIDFVSERYMGTLFEVILELLIALIGLIFAVFMIKYSLVLVSKATAWSPIFKISRKIFYISIPIAGTFMGIYSIRDIVIQVKRIMKKDALTGKETE